WGSKGCSTTAVGTSCIVSTSETTGAGAVGTTSSAGVCTARQRMEIRVSANPLVMVPTWQARQTFWEIRDITPVRYVWILSVGEHGDCIYSEMEWGRLSRLPRTIHCHGKWASKAGWQSRRGILPRPT